MREEIRLVAPLVADSGYSKMARAALRTLLLGGYRVQAVESDYRFQVKGFTDGTSKTERVYMKRHPKDPLPECQAEELKRARRTKVAITAPTLFIQIVESLEHWNEFSSGPRIGWTMQESDRMNPKWAFALGGVDLALAPSRYVLETFRRDARQVRSELLPLPVDARLWSPVSDKSGFNRANLPSFLFFSVFSSIPRKNWQLLMQGFMEEFAGEDVGLMVLPSRSPEVRELARWLNHDRPQSPQIQVICNHPTDADLADLYRLADCYALPSAEGFGLPFVEAAMCGTPSVALELGGSADVVNDVVGYPCRAHMAPCIGQLPHVYPSSHLFPTTDIMHLRNALRRAYDCEIGMRNTEAGTGKGEAARLDAMARFSPEALALPLREAIEEGARIFGGSKRMWPSSGRWILDEGMGYLNHDSSDYRIGMIGAKATSKADPSRMTAGGDLVDVVDRVDLVDMVDGGCPICKGKGYTKVPTLPQQDCPACIGTGRGPVSHILPPASRLLPEWGVVIGDGYGDALAVLGNVQQLLRDTGQEQLGVIHWGMGSGVARFLERQPCIRETRRIVAPDHESMMQVANLAGAYYSDIPERWLPGMLEGTGIDPDSVAMTQVHWPWGAWKVFRPAGVVLPDEAHEWADSFVKDVIGDRSSVISDPSSVGRRRGDFLVVQPYSLNSVEYHHHWQYWHKALRWLIDNSPYPLVFTGLTPIPGLHYDNVIDMVGKIPSMEAVMALCSRARGVVSTCNALALWTAIEGIPGLIAANAAIPDKNFFFYKFIDTKPNVVIGHEDSFEVWRKAAEGWMAGVTAPPNPLEGELSCAESGCAKGRGERLDSSAALGMTGGALGMTVDSVGMTVDSLGHMVCTGMAEEKKSMSETSKHRLIAEPYCQGNGVDLGSAGDPVVPWAIQVELPREQYHIYNLDRPEDVPIQWRGDATDLPFRDSVLDFVHSSHLLEDFEEWELVLAEWDRVLKPGGFMLISVPDHERFRAYVARGAAVGVDLDNLSHRHESRIGEVAGLFPDYETLFDGFVTPDPNEYSLLWVGRKRL